MNKYWVTPSPNIFDSTANWSLSSGGPGGAAIPGPADVAIFDTSGQGACILTNTVNILGMKVSSDYSGIILQQAYPLIIGTSDASINGGIFSGSTAPINIYGSLFIGETNFVCTSGTLTLWGDFVYSPETVSAPLVNPLIIQERTVTDFDATSRFMVLPKFPKEPLDIAVDTITGVAQVYGKDYNSYAVNLQWDGLDLQYDLATGDKIRYMYLADDTRGRFFHNYGTFKAMTTGAHFYPNGAHFYNLAIENDSTPISTRFIDRTSFVENKLLLNTGYLGRGGSDGTIYALSDVYPEQNFGKFFPGHNAQIAFVSEGEQNIFTSGGILPFVLVDKNTSEQVKSFGTNPLYISGDFVIADGTFNTKGMDIKVGTP